MAEYPYTRPENGHLERRVTRLEVISEHQGEDLAMVISTVDRIRSMAFQIVAAIAGSVLLVLVNILLGK